MLKLKTYEDQATISIILAAGGILGGAAATVIMMRRFDADAFYVTYSPQSLFLPALGVCLLGALAGGAGGFLLGFYTASQRRNKATRRSWTGFFLGAVAITLALSCGIFFYLTKNAYTPQTS
ncbi:MAG: hypothetical protein JXO22_14515 [Phycisphaerae bacterium]|nr:hypothetical protein [Phycisphaerae bacterium]